MTAPPTVVSSARSVIDAQRELRFLLSEVEFALAARDPHPAGGPDVVAARLDILRGRLAAHFGEEERAGLFDQIVQQAPGEAHECHRLLDEHAVLLHRLDDLRTADPEARRRPAWSGAVRRLLDELSGHESRENEVLTRALDGSVGALD
jgi:hypothetical protein